MLGAVVPQAAAISEKSKYLCPETERRTGIPNCQWTTSEGFSTMQLCVKFGCDGGSNILMPSSRTSFVWLGLCLGPTVHPLHIPASEVFSPLFYSPTGYGHAACRLPLHEMAPSNFGT